MEMTVVRGPQARLTAGDVLYQVTLASGAVITNPSDFEPPKPAPPEARAIVTLAGEILFKPRPES